MKKTILFLLLAIEIMPLCAQIRQKFVAGRAIIDGTVIGEVKDAPNVLTVIFCDPTIDNNKTRNVFNVSENKNFHAEANIFFTQNMTIKYGNTFYNLLVSPGDSIHITIDPSQDDIRKRIVFSGDNAELNNQFAPFVQYLYGLNIPMNIDMKIDNKEIIASFQNYIKTTKDSIDAYRQRYNLMPSIEEWAKRDVVFTMANQVFNYSAKQSVLASDSLFGIFDPDNFQSMYFPYHLTGYATSIIRNDTCYKKAESNNTKNKFDILLKAISKMPQSISRDYILFSFLKRYVDSADTIAMNIDDMVFDLFSNTYFTKRIKEEIAKRSSINIRPLKPIEGIAYLNAKGDVEKLSNIDIFEVLKKRAKGKVIYIDIYATWCGPCRAEIPAAKTLRKTYKGKDVMFAYLCLSSDFKDWQTIAVKDFDGGENYFFDTFASDLFTGLYADFFKGFPTFIIIDRKGNILTKGIPRPSDMHKAIELIDSLN